jgi:hypothetical protein
MKVGDIFLRSSYFTAGRVEKKYELSLGMNPFAKGIQTTARVLVMSSYEIQFGITVCNILSLYLTTLLSAASLVTVAERSKA